MDGFSERERVLLGYTPKNPFVSSSSASNTDQRNSDIDFDDVFGGPPRRSSVQEMRSSFSEAADSCGLRGENEMRLSLNPWTGIREKPVFGEEGANRRRYPSKDFFDDIFRGNESVSSSPRKHDRDPFSSSPGSRVLSPARPLPPKAEPFETSLPAQFSLPTKLTKGVELPTFGSGSRGKYKSKDGSSNGANYYSFSPLSRFSIQPKQSQEVTNDMASSLYQSNLLEELSIGNEEPSTLARNDGKEAAPDFKKNSTDQEVSNNGNQFHFSIYKWASRGAPVAMPLRGGLSSRFKEKAMERCSSSNGRIESENLIGGSATTKEHHPKPFRMEPEELANRSFLGSWNHKIEPCESSEEKILTISKSGTSSGHDSTVKNLPVDTTSCHRGEEMKPHSLSERGLSGIPEKEIFVVASEACKPESNSLKKLLDNDDELGNGKMTSKNTRKESKMETAKKSSVDLDRRKTKKKLEGKKDSPDSGEVGKASFRGSPMNSGDRAKTRKGKVKEFVKMFNQEVSLNTKGFDPQSRNLGGKVRGTSGGENINDASKTRTEGTGRNPNEETKPISDTPAMVDEYPQLFRKEDPAIKNTNHMSNGISGRKNSSESRSASVPDGSKMFSGDNDDTFQVNFLLKELSHDENQLLQTCTCPDEIQAIDAKIRKWSTGREGNIRSLLSTLQYVLWPESGWKPVPLVDIIEANGVKKSYQKALLCLHPDKLQQKGAASHQKYIAEKLFDILQEAWTHFNSLGSL